LSSEEDAAIAGTSHARTGSLPGGEPRRNPFFQFFWGCGGTLSVLGAMVLIFPPLLASPEYEEFVDLGYSVNMFHMMYFGVSVLAAFGMFAFWKAAHRSGLSFWRATLRPGLICICLAIMGGAANFTLNLAADKLQFVGLGFFSAAALAMWIIWSLRGPDVPLVPGEAYWQRVLSRLFLLMGVAAIVGAFSLFSSWGGEDRTFYNNGGLRTIDVVETYVDYNRGQRNIRTQTVERTISTPMFDARPVGAGFLALIAVCAIGESRYRRHLVKAAIEAERQKAPQQ
jgi:hypothetical protein